MNYDDADEEIIITYIEKCYSFDTNFKSEFLVYDKLNKKYYTKQKFIKVINKTFDSLNFKNNIINKDIPEKWFDDKLKSLTTEINEYLNNNLDVILGDKNWETINIDGTKFDKTQIVNKFSNKYNIELINFLYKSWYTKKVIETTDLLINKQMF